MGRIYTASFGGVTTDPATAVPQDIFEITAPADAVVRLISIILGQSSDYGDAQAEGLQVQISRATGAGSGGTAITPRPHHVGDAAFGGVVDRNNTTQATGTTVIHEDVWNVQAGWQYRPVPEEMIYISPSGILVVEMPVDPADTITLSGSITFEEIGG